MPRAIGASETAPASILFARFPGLVQSFNKPWAHTGKPVCASALLNPFFTSVFFDSCQSLNATIMRFTLKTTDKERFREFVR